jgi:hypothetical protein
MNAKQAIARSQSHNEIITLEEYNDDAFETLSVECDDCVEANGMHEFWCDSPEDNTAMQWRVHMPVVSEVSCEPNS